MFRAIVRLGEWDISSEVDCQDGICSDKPVDITIEEVFTRHDPDSEWVNNIALIKMSKEAQYSSRLIFYFAHQET